MRVSVTLLDSYRYWKHGEFFTEEQERKSYEELVGRIRGEPFVRNEAMERGVAWHSVCETPAEYRQGPVYRCDGFDFDIDSADEILLDPYGS